MDGIVASLIVNEPVGEVVFEWYIQVHIGFVLIYKVTENQRNNIKFNGKNGPLWETLPKKILCGENETIYATRLTALTR
jgi:hypothetical protein